MNALRRLAALAVVAAVAIAGNLVDRTPPEQASAVFGIETTSEMPIAPVGDALTTAWFCPGVPAPADGTAGGVVSVLNPADVPLQGQLTFVPSEGAAVVQPLEVAPFTRLAVRPSDVARAPVVAVLVEVYGTNAVVEQTATSEAGLSTTACASAAGTTWYAADGATTVDASSALVVFNPFPDDASVTVTFATEEGPRTPQSLRNYVVPARSVRVIDVDETVLRNTLVSSTVTAGSGRVVVGRLQTYNQPPRRGLVAGLVSPYAGTDWWFANGRKGAGIAERVVLYNPTEDEATVDITVFPSEAAAEPVAPISVTLAPTSSQVVDIAANEAVPEGVHSILVASTDVPIVAERSFDLTGEGRQATTDQVGSPLIASSWYSVTGAPDGGGSTLTVANPTGEDTSFTVFVLGTAGATPLPSADGIALPRAGTVRVDLTEAGVAGAPLLVQADPANARAALVVERFVTPGPDAPGATSYLAIPVAGT